MDLNDINIGWSNSNIQGADTDRAKIKKEPFINDFSEKFHNMMNLSS